MRRYGFWAVVALCCALAGGGRAAVVWQGDAVKDMRPDMLRNGAAVVDDGQASGGKAVRIPYGKDTGGWCVHYFTPALKLQGQCTFTFNLRGEGMLPISDGLWITTVAHDRHNGQWAASDQAPVYGVNLHPDGYAPVTMTVNVPQADSYPIEVIFEWKVGTPDITPVVYFDRITITSGDPPEIPELSPPLLSKIRYQPGERATAVMTLANRTGTPAQGTLFGEELSGLTDRRTVFTLPVALAAGETREITAHWTVGQEEYGRELLVTLRSGDKAATASNYFGVSRSLWLSVGNQEDAGGGPDSRTNAWQYYVGAAAMPESLRSMRKMKALSPGGECFEYFSWSGGDVSDLAPAEEPFAGNEGRMAFRSRELLRRQITQLKSMGFWPVTYTNGTCWAESGYQLMARHPEWFIYDTNGEVAHYEMDRREIYKRRNDLDFDPNTYPGIYFQGVLNYALPATVDYTAKNLIACGKEMGFQGVRFDVFFPSVGTGTRDFTGKDIVKTGTEADRMSAAIMHRVKALVHQQLPDFTFGYNYGSPEEMLGHPLTSQERCAGGGWILDEVPCTYQDATSPYHLWPAYLKRMVSWGDQINRWGGIYNPFDFRRGGRSTPSTAFTPPSSACSPAGAAPTVRFITIGDCRWATWAASPRATASSSSVANGAGCRR